MSEVSIFDQFLGSPLLWGFIALVAFAVSLSGKFDYTASHRILAVAWVFAVLCTARFTYMVQMPVLRRILVVTLAASALGLLLERVASWATPSPPVVTTAAAAPAPTSLSPGTTPPASGPETGPREVDPRLDMVIKKLDALGNVMPAAPPKPSSVSLGGSLTRGRLSDGLMVRTSGWLDVSDYHDASVDWHEVVGFRVIADLMVRASGRAQIGILDVTAGRIVVVSQDALPSARRPAGYVESTDKTLPDAENLKLELPEASGIRNYRIVFRRVDSSNATVWASGDLTFVSIRPETKPAEPRVVDLGNKDTLVNLAEDNVWIPTNEPVSVDWSGGEFVSASAMVSIKVVSPRGEPFSKVSVRLRDVASGATYSALERIDAPMHGGMGWLKKGSPDVAPTTGAASIVVPKGQGVQEFVLELAATKGGVSAAAHGRLSLFRR